MKANLNESGLNVFFKDWQTIIVEKVLSSDERITTREAFEYVNKALDGIKIGRSSVVLFLQGLEEEGFLSSVNKIGLGGIHKSYKRTMSLMQLWECVRCHFNKLADEALLTLG